MIAPRGKDPRVLGHHSFRHQWGVYRHHLFLLTPRMGQRDQFQVQSTAQVPSQSQTGQRGQSMGRGKGQGPQADTLGTQGRVYAIVPQAEPIEQSVI